MTRITLSEAKGQLTDLVRRAEAGEDIVLTRFGRDVARLIPTTARPTPAERRALMERVRESGGHEASAGPPAARSQDFLNDESGLPM